VDQNGWPGPSTWHPRWGSERLRRSVPIILLALLVVRYLRAMGAPGVERGASARSREVMYQAGSGSGSTATVACDEY
jgi:hypothetical protein